MFTGIVEEIGVVRALRGGPGGTHLTVAATTVLGGTRLGDSIAVDGACLTVTELLPDGFTVGLSPETLSRTSLGGLAAGDRVNLERSLAAGARMGGHYVQGHVDGVARIVEKRPDGDSLRMWFEAPEPLMPYIVEKGYISLDGASLTITERQGTRFGVALVAYSQEMLVLPTKPIGAPVNVEVDVIAKYVESLLEGRFERGRQPA
jgi:riboflavin synthase